MPWARLHALKDYLDMVEVLSDYPTIHQTFNLVPSLVEQLEDYASGGVADGYWELTIKPAAELSPAERAFIVERMCERSDHPRAKSHPRYLELAQKRESEAPRGWDAVGELFGVDELRDLQIWFNLAWFDPTVLEAPALAGLVERGRDYREEDKLVLAQVQGDILARVIPAYREAAERRQVELSTSPYFHPILPLLANSEAARVSAGDTVLPRRRFAHPEDAWEQVWSGLAKHEQVFAARPRGMWCSEQAVGEDVLPLLMRAGIEWTISDQTVLSRSLSGSASRGGARTPGEAGPAVVLPYMPRLLRREEGEMAIVFRDHTLSDLIGFGYQSWDSRDAAHDLLRRIRGMGAGSASLVTIALDGENAWEYYPHDGRDFLRYLYEGLADDPAIRCVTVSEHLDEHPATEMLDWLHTGSWIGGDLRTWSGDPGHNAAWDLLHDARDLAASRRASAAVAGRQSGAEGTAGDDVAGEVRRPGERADRPEAAEAAWHHILVVEGSDWYWWFGEHHHTELDHVWDLEFRHHLQEVYRLLDQPIPLRLYLPVLTATPTTGPPSPLGTIEPVIDGRLRTEDGWDASGLLPLDQPSTMQRADGTRIVETRFGWGKEHLYILLIPRDATDLEGLELELRVTPAGGEDGTVFHMELAEGGRMKVSRSGCGHPAGTAWGAWGDVVEIAVPLVVPPLVGDGRLGLILQVGRGGMTDHVFRSAGLAHVGEAGS